MILQKSYKIIPKSGGLIPFEPNRIQKIVGNVQARFRKLYILKGRQFGITTLLKLIDFDFALANVGVNSLTIADTTDNAEKIFRKVRTAYDNLPENFRNKLAVDLNNVRELTIKSNQSSIAVDTSARSMTVQRLHLSEYAFYKKKLYEESMTGTMEALPKDGSVVIETTANGMNHAYTTWNEDCNYYEFRNGEFDFYSGFDATKEWVGLFLPWYWHDEYQLPVPDGVRKELREVYDTLAEQYDLIPKAYDIYGLSDEQLYWYIIKIRQNKNLVKREYPLNAQEAFLASGKVIFDLNVLSTKIFKKPVIIERGVNIYELPKKGDDYIIGVDPAEGVDGDSSGVVIIGIDPLRIVAVFKSNTIQQHDLADKVAWLGEKYNDAFVVPERNMGLAMILKLEEMGYSNIYRQTSIDSKDKKESKKLGWRTTGANRDLIIDNFIEIYEEEQIDITSEIAEEMMHFVQKDDGKREHEDGFHDDVLFALFLALIGIRYRVDRSFEMRRLG